MKRGKSKLLSDTDVKNCLRFINDMPSHQERTRLMFLMMLMTSLRIHSIQKLTIGQVYDEKFNPVESFCFNQNKTKAEKRLCKSI